MTIRDRERLCMTVQVGVDGSNYFLFFYRTGEKEEDCHQCGEELPCKCKCKCGNYLYPGEICECKISLRK